MAQPFATVTVKGLDKTMKRLEKKYGKKRINRYGGRVLKNAAVRHIVPAVRAETPTQMSRGGVSSGYNEMPDEYPSPWRREDGPKVNKPGPMKKRVYAKQLRPRAGMGPAAFVGIRTSYHKVVVRGSDPHPQPNNPRYRRSGHPGARARDIWGRALARSGDAAAQEIIRRILRAK